MTMKTWTANDIRALAKQTVDGRSKLNNARGEYLKALIATAQLEIGEAKPDQVEQRRIVREVNQRFAQIVLEAIATDEILLEAGIPRKGVALERNRRLNFVRTNLGAVRRWLRAPGHDLTKLDATKITKTQLLEDAPPANRHALTRKRVQAKYDRQITRLLELIKETAKHDPALAEDLAARATRWFAKYMSPKKEAAGGHKQRLLKAA